MFCKYAKEYPDLGMTPAEFAEFLSREQEVSNGELLHLTSVRWHPCWVFGKYTNYKLSRMLMILFDMLYMLLMVKLSVTVTVVM